MRLAVVLAGLIMLVLWGASLIPTVESWHDPRADGFQLIPAFYASLTALPMGMVALMAAFRAAKKE